MSERWVEVTLCRDGGRVFLNVADAFTIRRITDDPRGEHTRIFFRDGTEEPFEVRELPEELISPAAAISAETEACAALCDSYSERAFAAHPMAQEAGAAARNLATAIRKRRQGGTNDA